MAERIGLSHKLIRNSLYVAKDMVNARRIAVCMEYAIGDNMKVIYFRVVNWHTSLT